MLEKIKQEYTPYWSWECFNNGMWSKVDKQTEDKMLKIAIDFTSNHIEYGKSMRAVSAKWENTMLNNLTNKSINRKAFIGHCAVSYKLNIPEYITRKAWSYLNATQQMLANGEAKKSIELWEKQYLKKLRATKKYGLTDVTKMDFQMKFQLK